MKPKKSFLRRFLVCKWIILMPIVCVFLIGAIIFLCISFWFEISSLKQSKEYLLHQIEKEDIKRSVLANKIKAGNNKNAILLQEIIDLQNKESAMKSSNTSMIYEDAQNEYRMSLYELEIAKNMQNELAETGKTIGNQLSFQKLKEIELINLYHHYEDNLNQIQSKGKEKGVLAIKSNILNEEDVKLLTDWLGNSEKISLVLKYGGKGTEINAADFHLKCDDSLSTIVVLKIVETEQKIGGFTTLSWKGKGYKSDNKAFLFNLNTKKVYPVDEAMNAINCHPKSLPIFGSEDLSLSSTKGKSIFPSYYGRSHQRCELTQGKREFSIEYMEVFEIYLILNL